MSDLVSRDLAKLAVFCNRGDVAAQNDAIDALPPVDAVPVVHGRWRNGICDQCSGHAPFWSMATTYYQSNFCPHCGADMRGEE